MKNLREEQLRRMKALQQNKETELNGNRSDPSPSEPEQDTKRTESSQKKDTKSKSNKQDLNETDNNETPKEKPKPFNDRNKFEMEMNEGGAYVPEPYQYVPTFDDKLLEREYKLKIPTPRLDDAMTDQIGDYEYGLPDDTDFPPIPKVPRHRYENRNRGVRSKNEKIMIQDSSIVKKNLNDRVNGNQQQPNGKQRPESLWDLELEKEEYEAYRFKRQFDKETIPESPLKLDVLPAISSTGVLLASLNMTKNSIDYVFVLNVRESEKYPPLLRKEDIDCVEEKMQGFRSYAETELRRLERTFFKQCLGKRLPFLQPPYQRFETEIVVTRIRIECKCSEDLDPAREKCSDLNPVGKQQWPEFMGKNKNGAYKSRR